MSGPETNETQAERKVRLARLSGKATAAWLVGFFLLIGFLIPTVVGLPLWLDFEIVLAGWWLVWLAVLTRLLYIGQRVADDHQLGAPRNWLGTSKTEDKAKKDPLDIRKPEASSSTGSWWYWLDFSGPADAEGCAAILAIIVGAVVLFGLIWFLVEIAIPVIVFVLYLVVRGMLAHVINDRHHCRGKLGRAMAWAFVWATVYMAPLAGVVCFAHYIVSRQTAA
jgi:hypothetical protein